MGSHQGTGPGRIPAVSNVALLVLSIYGAFGNYTFSGFSLIVIAFIAFAVIFAGLTFGLRTGRRMVPLVSVVTAFGYIVFSIPVTRVLSEPTAFPPFIFAVMAPPIALLSIVSSLLSWRETRLLAGKTPPNQTRGWASAFLAFAVIGFIAGSLLVGGLAAVTESTLVANSGAIGNITIVVGGGNQDTTLPYSPSPYTVKVGSTVTWVNKDLSTHTVTSFGSTLFDSGDIPPGGTYSFTFTQVGNYTYYCTIHPWMKGTIVVRSG